MLFFVVNIIEDVKMFVKISINKIRFKADHILEIPGLKLFCDYEL